jgi:hypothetical protein
MHILHLVSGDSAISAFQDGSKRGIQVSVPTPVLTMNRPFLPNPLPDKKSRVRRVAHGSLELNLI